MSEREQVQNEIAEHIRGLKWNNGARMYDAPFGVLENLEPVQGGGYLRTITFGVAGKLDGRVVIARPNQIRIEGVGALAHRVAGDYASLAAAKAALDLREEAA